MIYPYTKSISTYMWFPHFRQSKIPQPKTHAFKGEMKRKSWPKPWPPSWRRPAYGVNGGIDTLNNVGKTNAQPWLVGGLEHYFFPYIGNFIIPTDELIFFRGVETANQMVINGYIWLLIMVNAY